MASIPYRDIVGSHPFQFLIGPDKKAFTIHSSLVAGQSAALSALVDGELKEAKEKCVIWKDVDEETFLRFSQFAYTGTYNDPEPQKRDIKETLIAANVEKLEGDIVPVPVKKKVARPTGPIFPSVEPLRDALWAKFCSLYPAPQSKVAMHVNELNEDYTQVFLSHAQMYVFADYYGIKNLEKLALGKLRQTLEGYRLHDVGVSDIIQLLEYCFHETADKGTKRDPLRILVCKYAACKAEELWRVDGFRQLFDTLPEFPRALFTEVQHRLG